MSDTRPMSDTLAPERTLLARTGPSSGVMDAVIAWALRPTSWGALALLAAAAATFGALLIKAGLFVVGTQLNDFFLFVDFTHRWSEGQLPHRDYQTPLGLFTTLLPFLGFRLTGDYAVGMHAAALIGLALLAPVFAAAARTRLVNGHAVIVGGVLILLVLTPADLLYGTAEPTPAMAYNRLGWAVALVAALFLAPPLTGRAPGAARLDLVCLALLLVFAAFLKATVGVALGAIGLLYLWLRPAGLSLRDLIPGMLAGLAAFALIEVSLGITRGYIADLLFVAGIEGGARMGPLRFAWAAVQSLGDLILGFPLPIALLAAAGRGRARLVAALGLLTLLALALVLQNAQTMRLPLMVAVACLAAAPLVGEGNAQSLRVVAVLLPLAAAAPFLDHAARTWDRIARLAAKGDLVRSPLPGLAGLAVLNDGDARLIRAGLSNAVSARETIYAIARLPPTGPQQFRQSDALAQAAAAVEVLGECRLDGGGVLLADFSNPVAALAGLKPAGRFPLIHEDRSFSAKVHPPAEDVFGGVDCVLIPRSPMEASNTDRFLAVYGPEIARRYPEVVETTLFTVRRRR